MKEGVFEAGRERMIKMFSELEIATWPEPHRVGKQYALVVPRNHPSLIGRGNNSLVFEIPNLDLVGKGFKYTQTSEFEWIPEDELHLVGCVSGLVNDYYGLPVTVYWLKQMKLGVEMPEVREYVEYFGKGSIAEQKRLFFTVTSDLREGRQYQVAEAEDSLFERLSNGEELRRVRDETCRRILDEAEKRRLRIYPAGHGSEEDVLPALEHMFLVPYNRDNGRLVIGDLNHLYIAEKGRQFGIKPNYLD